MAAISSTASCLCLQSVPEVTFGKEVYARRNPVHIFLFPYDVRTAPGLPCEYLEEEDSMKLCKVTLAVALVAAACLPAVAQSQMGLDMPFDFTANGKTYPPGTTTFGKHFKAIDVCAALQLHSIDFPPDPS
jgi:hypothetical protein